MLLKIPGFLWAALVVASGALAAEAPACNGRVVDEAHRPVAHARIHVIYADGTIESERSDEAGEFRLNLAGPLPARLQVLVAGFSFAGRQLLGDAALRRRRGERGQPAHGIRIPVQAPAVRAGPVR